MSSLATFAAVVVVVVVVVACCSFYTTQSSTPEGPEPILLRSYSQSTRTTEYTKVLVRERGMTGVVGSQAARKCNLERNTIGTYLYVLWRQGGDMYYHFTLTPAKRADRLIEPG